MNPHEASLSRHPLAQLAVAFSAGICAANYFPMQLVVLLIVGGVCTAMAVVALVKGRHALAGVALLLAIGVTGAMLASKESREKNSELEQLVGRQVIVTGVLSRPPEVGTDRLYLTLSVEHLDVDGSSRIASGVISLFAPLDIKSLQLRYGTRVRVVAKLSRTDRYRNPGVSPLSEYLDRKGYDATGVVQNVAAITRLEDAQVFAPLALLYSWRETSRWPIQRK